MATHLDRVLLAGQNELRRLENVAVSAPSTASADVLSVIMDTEPTDAIKKKKEFPKFKKGRWRIREDYMQKQAAIWEPPPPLSSSKFDADSLPVYVAVRSMPHLQKQEMTIQKVVQEKKPKVIPGTYKQTLYPRNVGDRYVAEMVDEKLRGKDRGFYFQPIFTDPEDPKGDANMVDVEISWLEFTNDEIDKVCKDVEALAPGEGGRGCETGRGSESHAILRRWAAFRHWPRGGRNTGRTGR